MYASLFAVKVNYGTEDKALLALIWHVTYVKKMAPRNYATSYLF
jgi:hypothetical protein